MSTPELVALKAQAKWLLELAERINCAAQALDKPDDQYNSHVNASGTITNLCPEVCKAASKLRSMPRTHSSYSYLNGTR